MDYFSSFFRSLHECPVKDVPRSVLSGTVGCGIPALRCLGFEGIRVEGLRARAEGCSAKFLKRIALLDSRLIWLLPFHDLKVKVKDLGVGFLYFRVDVVGRRGASPRALSARADFMGSWVLVLQGLRCEILTPLPQVQSR